MLSHASVSARFGQERPKIDTVWCARNWVGVWCRPLYGFILVWPRCRLFVNDATDVGWMEIDLFNEATYLSNCDRLGVLTGGMRRAVLNDAMINTPRMITSSILSIMILRHNCFKHVNLAVKCGLERH